MLSSVETPTSLEARLALLRCPVSGAKLVMLAAERLLALNGAIMQGQVTTRGGAVVQRPLTGALGTVHGEWLYAVRGDGIFVLLADDAIAAPAGPAA